MAACGCTATRHSAWSEVPPGYTTVKSTFSLLDLRFDLCEYLDEAAERYRKVLMERFEAPAEARTWCAKGGTVAGRTPLMDLGMGISR